MRHWVEIFSVVFIFCGVFAIAGQHEVGKQDDSFLSPTDSSFVVPPGINPVGSIPTWETPLVHMPRTWKSWYDREFQWERVPFYVGIAGATAALMHYDRTLYTPLRTLHQNNYTFRKFAQYSEFMGQGWFQFGLAGAFLIEGEVTGNTKSLETASQTVEVILTCGGVIQLLKHVTGRETPILATSPTGKWRFFPNQISYIKHVPEYDAFPTGHLATATATLTVIMENYPETKWIPYVGYPAIACIGVAMVGQGIHWFSDYPLGIAIGYSFAKVVFRRNEESKSITTHSVFDPDIDIVMMSTGTPGLFLEWRW